MLIELRKLSQAVLHRAWLQPSRLAYALAPFAALYWLAIGARFLLYRTGIFQVRRVNALVVVVGNVILGGAGKTPTVIELVQHLSGLGLQVGVVSRGYGRSTSICTEVTDSSFASEVGDEPKLIQSVTRIPVFVAKSRHQGATELLRKYPHTKVIICDDGLQHFGLFRDLEVCVFDNRGIGNGWLFPSGPLREPWPRHMLLSSGQCAERTMVLHTGTRPAFQGFIARRTLLPQGTRRSGDKVDLRCLSGESSKPLMAVAGIAQPENFFSMLEQMGLNLQEKIGLSDHYDFGHFDNNADGQFQILCTDKDADKLWSSDPDAIAVTLIQEADRDFYEALDTKISKLLANR